MSYLLCFLAGLLFEGLYLAWLIAAQRGMAKSAALLSAMVGAASFYGVSQGVRDVRMLPAYLAGYAAGSYLVVRWTDRKPGASYS